MTRIQLTGRQRVAVLFTAPGPALANAPKLVREAEDLAPTARTVAKALRSLGHSVRCFAFGDDPRSLIDQLRAARPEVVFNLAEAPLGVYEKEPHALALLELLGLPYTGNGPFATTLCKDKAMTKEILQARGIPSPRFCVYTKLPTARPSVPFPLLVKPLRQDGSIGITEKSIVRNQDELVQAVNELQERHRQEALVEEFLPGREIQMSVIGNGAPGARYRVLPPSEYVYHSPRWRVCTFEAKWDQTHPSYAAVEAVNPARLSAGLLRQFEKLTLECAAVFGLSGYARVDFRLDKAGRPHVLEVNPNPDLSPRMGIARAAETAGMAYPEFVQEIMRLGLAKGVR